MQKIIPYLWFDTHALEAAQFYVSLFRDSRIIQKEYYEAASSKISGQPKGSLLSVLFEIAGQRFGAMNGGPMFKFTPAISFMVACDNAAEIERMYENLSRDGGVLMEFAKYPFAEKYAWVVDKYGVSWQLILAKRKQKITPVIMFNGKIYGRAKEAMEFYTELFKGWDEDYTKILSTEYYQEGTPDGPNKVVHGVFELEGQEFVAMDSGEDHKFEITPAISFMVECQNQEEIDYFWDKISFTGKEIECGWVMDKFGVYWQIVPTVLSELLQDQDKVKVSRVMRAMLSMKKLDIEGLKKAYANSI